MTTSKIRADITKVKNRLKKRTIVENFGVTEVHKLEDKHGRHDLIDRFAEWCMNYTG